MGEAKSMPCMDRGKTLWW